MDNACAFAAGGPKMFGVRLVVLTVIVLLGTVACSGQDQSRRSAREEGPSAAPSSSVDAAAAVDLARQTYIRYLSLDERSLLAATADPEAGRVLTRRALRDERASAEDLRRRGLTIRGVTSLRRFQLQRFDPRRGVLTAYACVDLSKTRVLDRKGRDVTPEERADLQTSLPAFVLRGGSMKLEENGTWAGKSIC